MMIITKNENDDDDATAQQSPFHLISSGIGLGYNCNKRDNIHKRGSLFHHPGLGQCAAGATSCSDAAYTGNEHPPPRHGIALSPIGSTQNFREVSLNGSVNGKINKR